MNFNNAILSYDEEAFAQQLCAEELVEMLSYGDISSFIDIGAGTGFASIEVLKKFPEAKPTLLDISLKMLKVAQSKISNATIISADAERFDFATCNFDLAIANLSVQWFKDFETFLKKILPVTKYFAFSIPLTGSFVEYKSIFKNIELPSLRLYSESEILDIILRNADVKMTKRFTVNKTYATALEATRHFKNIGATMPLDARTQSKISVILKSYKAPVSLSYDLLLCLVKCES